MKFKDKVKIKKLKKKALAFDNDACVQIGLIYLNNKEYEEAHDYFAVAAQRNSMQGLFYLAEMNFEAYMPAKASSYQAFDQYQRAYKLGSTHALFRIGCCYFLGKGVERDHKKALDCFLKYANETNSTDAIINIGKIYVQGKDGIKVNLSYALQCFETVLNKYNCLDSLNDLGLLYEQLGHPLDARACYLRAAREKNDGLAMNNLGVMYFKGKGVTQSYHKAAYYFDFAIRNGCKTSRSNLALIYTYGLGGYKDLERGYELAKEAKDDGDILAIYLFGLFHEWGYKVDKNYQQALHYYRVAAQYGCDLAVKKLKDLHEPLKVN